MEVWASLPALGGVHLFDGSHWVQENSPWVGWGRMVAAGSLDASFGVQKKDWPLSPAGTLAIFVVRGS